MKWDFLIKLIGVLLKGVLVIGLESSYDCDKYNKKLILEEKKFILYFYLKVCICIMVV